MSELYRENPAEEEVRPREEPPAFPVHLPLASRRVVLFGAGAIALRRVNTLLPFGCRIQVVAPSACPEILALAERGEILYQAQCYRPGQEQGATLVVAATGNREVNRQIGLACREQNILVSVADCAGECSFFFPAVVRSGPLVYSLGADGCHHRQVKEAAAQLRRQLQPGGEGDLYGGDNTGRQPGKPAGRCPGPAGDGAHPGAAPAGAAGACHHEDHGG